MYFNETTHDNTMDCSVSLAATMLLIAGIRNRDVFNTIGGFRGNSFT